MSGLSWYLAYKSKPKNTHIVVLSLGSFVTRADKQSIPMVPTPSDQTRDQDLIEAYLRGDPKAFGTLFQRHKRGIYLLVQQHFPNPEKAEEVFQEVFMKILERLERFQASGSFRAWIYTLCRNHCIDRLRYYGRRPEYPESSFGDPEDGQPGAISKEPSPLAPADERAYGRELSEQIRKALQKLPEDQRETFLLKELGGLTFEEIGQAMGVSVNTVKSRMRYALEHLRRILKNKAAVKEALQ